MESPARNSCGIGVGARGEPGPGLTGAGRRPPEAVGTSRGLRSIWRGGDPASRGARGTPRCMVIGRLTGGMPVDRRIDDLVSVLLEGRCNVLVSPYYPTSGGTVIDWEPTDEED